MSSAEYKHETPKSQRGVLYHQTAKLSEYVIGDILPRAKKIEERLREIEQSQPQPPSPSVPNSDARPMGSLRDRMRMLEQAGLDVGNQPQRPVKPAKPTVDPAPTKPIDPPPLLEPNPPPLEPASPSSRGTSSIQHDLAYLNNITGTNGLGAPPPLNGAHSPSTLPTAPPQFNSSSTVATPITGMFGITASPSPGGSSTATMTIPQPTQPSLPPLQTSPPSITRTRSPRSMSLNIASPTNGNNIGSTSPSGTDRPPIPPRLSPNNTGGISPNGIASITSRASTVGTSTPPLSKSALWNSPQHTGAGMNGVTSNGTGTGGRGLPLSPLATGGSIAAGPISPLATGGAGVLSPRATGGEGLGLGLGLHEPDEPSRPPKQRSATTEAFEAAYPSIDDIEATYPSLDALESEAEMKLLKLGVPTSAPGGIGPPSLVDAPSLGFEFGQKSPVPRPFPNAIPDLEGVPRPASTPANGARPGISFGSAKSPSQTQPQSPRPPTTPAPPKSDKLPKPDLPITNTITAKTLKSYLATALQILVLDVRPRDEFDSRRIPVENVVCIEPIVLSRKGMSAKELQEALVISSKTERTLFEQRNTFDLVVLTDASSTEFKDPTTPLNLLFRIIYETEFLKPLRRSPVFLYGGIKAWGNEVGEFKGEDVVVAPSADAGKALSRKPAVSGRQAAGSVSHARMPQDVGLSGSSFGAVRTPITYPERAVSPPTSSGTPAHSQRPLEDMMSPPPPANAGYFEHPHHAYSGSVTLSTTRPASIDYPNLIRLPPAAASPTMDRVDSRPRIPQAPKPPQFKPDYSVVYWRDEQLGMSGLRNMGNTCYMNSVLQCLSGTVPLTRFFTDRRWHHEVNMMNPLGTRGELANAFYALLRDMWQGDLPYLTPVPFRKSICAHARQFAGSEQHDAQEFLLFLLDGIHEDLNRIIVKPQFEELTPEREAELERMPKQLAGAHEWARYKRRNDSIIVDYFQGQFCNQMQCLTCGQTSTTYNAFLNLSVPIPAAKGVTKVSLDDCIKALVGREVMDNADAWHCPRCKTARRAAKQLTFSRMPPVLIIHLKRFSFKGPFTDKLETLVEFPLKDLDLTNYMPPPLTPNMDKDGLERFSSQDPRAQIPPYKYELYGVANHFGSLSSGHYTAFVKSRGKWMYCDDSRITPAESKEVVGKPAYILFYKRVPPGQ
ncbi:ubiquitin carboxyl-terminal hydrolase 8 [Rhizoctonia solani]|uniref:ubiquitinyl hydrolase 1 n=1 Tax=Rhizoctonia solani TaxID=456999 RepID=A0A0K6FWQ4_9AGAM|nr:ubiquitin carboxyl-terminal hydrolase 8 [Rhizoctonia solani]